MEIYLIIFSALALLSLLHENMRPNKFVLFSVILILFLFVGARQYTIGCDTPTYQFQYNNLLTYGFVSDFTDIFQRDEFGYWLLKYILVKFDLGFVWLNIACAAIFFFGVYKFSSRAPNPYTILALIFPILVIQLSMAGVRQACAAGFLMMSFASYIDKKQIMCGIYILIGFLFHSSVIIFLPIIFTIGKDIKLRYLAMGTIFAAPLVAFLFQSRFDVYITRYADGEITSAGALLRVGLLTIPLVPYFVLRKRIDLVFPAFRNFSFITGVAALSLIPVVLYSSLAAHRLTYYFVPPAALILVTLCKYLDRGNRIPGALLFALLVYSAYILVWFSTSFHAGYCYVPYKSLIWDSLLSNPA